MMKNPQQVELTRIAAYFQLIFVVIFHNCLLIKKIICNENLVLCSKHKNAYT